MAEETGESIGVDPKHPNYDPVFAEKIRKTQEIERIKGSSTTTFANEQAAAEAGEMSPEQQIVSVLDGFNTARHEFKNKVLTERNYEEQRQVAQGKLSLMAQKGEITDNLRGRFEQKAEEYGLKLTPPEAIEAERKKQSILGRITGLFGGGQKEAPEENVKH